MEWQPIETAAESAAPVIVKGFYDFQRNERMWAAAAVLRNGSWWRENNSYGFTVSCYPTHWVPMPGSAASPNVRAERPQTAAPPPE